MAILWQLKMNNVFTKGIRELAIDEQSDHLVCHSVPFRFGFNITLNKRLDTEKLI